MKVALPAAPATPHPPPPLRQTRRRAGLSRAAVEAAAIGIADREGLAAVTLARLAATLGVRPPSLYKHVASLDDVFRGVAVAGLGEANERIRRTVIGKAGDAALLALAHAYRAFARERPGLYAASLRPAGPRERDVAAAADALGASVAAVLGSYGLDKADALHAMRGLRAILHGFVALEAAGGFRLSLDPEESLARLLRAFARDLAERGAVG
jgi:AcrR family transcriptional regulator